MNALVVEAQKYVGAGYTYAAQGQILTRELLDQLIKQYGTRHYKFTDSQGVVDASKWIGKQVFDCSGLVMYCLQQLKLVPLTVDYTAHMLFHDYCAEIQKDDLQLGDLVFVRNASNYIEHAGIYAGDGQCIEARGTRYGVVNIALRTTFNKFGRLKLKIPDITVAPVWKKEMANYLYQQGYTTVLHDPLELVDIGTLGAIIRNTKV